MKVTLIQMDIKWGDIAANCNTASEMIDSQPGSDLYVLPEMWSTGFATEPEGIADDTLASLSWMKEKANETNAAIAGSVATKAEDGTYRNRFYFVAPKKTAPQAPQMGGCPKNDLESGNPSGQNILSHPPTGGAWGAVYFYDKHHLFTYGKEQLHYTAGQERVIVEWRGVRFLLQICYDLRFPCFARNVVVPQDKAPQAKETAPKKTAPQAPQMGGCPKNDLGSGNPSVQKGDIETGLPSVQNILSHPPTWGAWGAASGAFDAIIYVASWPTSRIDPWHALLKARAIENQCYVLGVDRIGTDPACQYCGGTEIIDAYGRVIEACPDNVATTITTELDMDALTAFRKKFPVLNDADWEY